MLRGHGAEYSTNDWVGLGNINSLDIIKGRGITLVPQSHERAGAEQPFAGLQNQLAGLQWRGHDLAHDVLHCSHDSQADKEMRPQLQSVV